MTTTTAVARKIHLSAQKGRLVADQIRGLPVAQALNILNFSPKKAAVIIKKALESAIANAEHNDGADIDELKVKVQAEVPASWQDELEEMAHRLDVRKPTPKARSAGHAATSTS